ncbi:Zn2/Cys6 DNA-binding protein [Glarea lozoyensis ATCC 20868]|uniref:Zn2/Cys6 DNA-binding protein n=1 Tax=Glarea lozoyensis (strain ATCC 20868 / MF5171) TaxID=1116229 RepID=S3CKV8_GLAL2|nr:Zn2/Cys6 DNA-binding protein [Glarea lozoyensis ATCC 20868]EPE25824.1 Zn2/Cys6 DNA-binding protein [Glarea lozoyensis ATCC 20868]
MPDTDEFKGARKPHRKTRTGCASCKKRRIKCDEAKPTCLNCKKHNIACPFSISSSSLTSDSDSTQNPPSNARRFVPSRYQDQVLPSSVCQKRDLSPATHLTPTGVQNSPVIPTFTAEEFELWHHFLMITCPTIGDDPGSLRFWQMNVPNIGFSNQFVLHLTLALAAFHLGRTNPERRAKYIALAEKHETIALQGVTTVLPGLDSMNCEALYAAATLICFCYLAKGPQSGEFIAFSETGNIQWLILLGGVRSIMDSKRAELYAAVLGPIQEASASYKPAKRKRDSVPDYVQPLEELRRHIESRAATYSFDAGICLKVLDNLVKSFHAVYERIIRTGEDDRRHSPQVFGWLYRLPPEFTQLLIEKCSAGLIILAHFVVLLKEIDYYWFIEGWAEHMMSGIKNILGKEHETLIEWPIRQIRRAEA